MKKSLLLILMMVMNSGYAAVYESRDNNGSITYSDTPTSNASQIQVPAVNSINNSTPAPSSTASTAVANTSATTAATATPTESSTTLTYKIFEITSPKDGETIQNQPVIPIEMKIEPLMQTGDKIQLYLDGKATGTPNSTMYQEIGLVERGTHSVYAVIIDKGGKPLKQSNTITLYVHRNSTLTSPAGGGN